MALSDISATATCVHIPRGSYSHPPASPGDPPRPAGKSGPGSYEVTAFALGPSVRETLCVSPKSGVCFPHPVEFLQSNPAAFKAKYSGGFSS